MVDNLSPVFRSINAVLQMTVNGFENLQGASGEAIDVSQLQQAQRELSKIDSMLDRIENEIRDADNAQGKFNNRIRDGTGAMGGLLNKVGTLIGAYLSLQALGKVIEISDELTNTNARVSLLVEDMPVIPTQFAKVDFGLGDMSDIELAQQMIHDAAQRSLSSYKDTADMVSRIGANAGDIFGNVAEVVAFTELVQKQFGIAGANAVEASNATLQLSQALASGVLRGDELNSIFEQAPNLIHTIADYMDEPIGRIRELAADGAITADIVKNAMFAATDEINTKFDSMPVTWAQMWTVFQNDALRAFGPVLEGINDIANSERFKAFASSATQALYMVAAATEFIFNLLASVGAFAYDNWQYIGPVVIGVAVALGILLTYLALVELATMAVSAATWLWNAALAANPVVWVVLAIVALITILYLAVAAFNDLAGTSVSATGIIVGVLFSALAFIGNLFVVFFNLVIDGIALIYNGVAIFAEFLANVFVDPVGSIMRLFADLANYILSVLQSIASAIDTIFGSSLSGAVGGWMSTLDAAVKDKYGEAAVKIPRMNAQEFHWDRFEYGKAWDFGYDKGKNFGQGIKMPNTGGDRLTDGLMKSMAMGDKLDSLGQKADSGNDAAKKTAGNTKKLADGVKLMNDELKYLRDLAEREVINRYTTAEITIDARSENNISSEADLDGIIDGIVEKLEEAAEMAAEGGNFDV